MKITELIEQIAAVGTPQPTAAPPNTLSTATAAPLDIKSQADLLKQKTMQRKSIQDQIAALNKQITDLRMQQNSIK